MKFLFYFDLFSQKPTLKINGDSKIKNIYVAVLGLFVIIGVLIVSIILSLDIFNKSIVNIIQNIVSNRYINITLDTSIPISIFVTDNFGEEFNDHDRIYELEARYSTYIPTNSQNPRENLQIIKIKNTKCEYKRLEGDVESKYDNIYKISKTMKCFDLKPYNIHIFGDENPGLPQGLLQFYLNKCTNTTTKTNCLPQEEIDKKLSGVKMSFIFPNKDIDNLSTNPIINFTDGKTFRFASSIKTKYLLEIDEINFSLDEGLFFESMNYKKSYTIENMSSFQDNQIGGGISPGIFGIVNIKCSGKQKNYKRTYKKFESLFPLFYTIYYFSVLFFKILVKFLLKGNLEELLFYKIFDNETFSKIKNFKNKLTYENLFRKNTIKNSILSEVSKKKSNYNNNSIDNHSNIINYKFIGVNENINNNIDYNINNNSRLKLDNISIKENQHLNLNKNDNEIQSINNLDRKYYLNRRRIPHLKSGIKKRKIVNNNENYNQIENDSRGKIIHDVNNLIKINDNNVENEEINKEKDQNLQK
jgi:hypothetical protein